MYNTMLMSLLALSPLILQTTTTQPSISADPVGDLVKAILGLIAVVLSPIIIRKINEIRDAVKVSKATAEANTKSVQVLDTSVGEIFKRVSQLETDLSRAIGERDQAQALVISNAAAAEAAKQFSDVQIKLLTDQLRTKDNDLITERVINSELANNIRELREEISQLKERCMLLENSGTIADAIASKLVEINSAT